jgi:hypothetical protein
VVLVRDTRLLRVGSIPNGILFGLAMSAIFFITTGEFLVYLRPWWGGWRRVDVNGGGPPHEGTYLQKHMEIEKRHSFFDEQQLVRWVSGGTGNLKVLLLRRIVMIMVMTMMTRPPLTCLVLSGGRAFCSPRMRLIVSSLYP